MPDASTGESRDVQRIAEELRRMFEGNAWHGPSVRDALTGVTAGMAVATSLPGAHNIYELTHHSGAWVGEVTRRLRGEKPGSPADGDFPPKGAHVDEASWHALLDRLTARHEELMAAIRGFDPSRLDDVVGGATSEESRVTYRAMLHGVVSHDAYHAGQIVLLRKSLG